MVTFELEIEELEADEFCGYAIIDVTCEIDDGEKPSWDHPGVPPHGCCVSWEYGELEVCDDTGERVRDDKALREIFRPAVENWLQSHPETISAMALQANEW